MSATDLESLSTGLSGSIKLLPSSRNYNWFCSEDDVDKKNICSGKVITLGRARHANTKYWEGKFISSQNHIVRVKDEKVLMPKYLYYLIRQHEKEFYITESSYPLFTRTVFEELVIPVPPLSVQEEIVRILDYFDLLCSDISGCIPALIKSSQSQYEYYRDKLLTFKNCGCNA